MARKELYARIRSFTADRRGSSAMIFGLSSVPIIMLVAAGLDYGRAVDQKSKLQQATDAATLAATRLLSTNPSTTTLQQQAQNFLVAASADPNAVIVSGPTVSSNNTAICMSTRTTLNTTLMRAAAGMGFVPPSMLTVSASSCTKINDVTYEIALVLDNSGSMSASTSGTTKIASLQTAATQMIATMNPIPTAPRATFSIVPFSSAVKIGAQYQNATFIDTGGKSSIHWQNFALPTPTRKNNPVSKFDLLAGMNMSWGGCVEERPDPYMTTDTIANVTNPDTLFVPYFYPDEHVLNYNSWTKTYTYGSSTNTYINLDLNGEAGACTQNDAYDKADSSAVMTRSGIALENVVGNSVWGLTQTKVCKYQSSAKNNDVLTATSAFGSGFPAGPNLLCDSQPITTLSNDNTVLNAAVQSLYAKGDTNILSGLMWGWRTISPNGPFNTQTTTAGAIGNQNAKIYSSSASANSAAANNVKVMIVMTDGMNHWSNISGDPNNSAYSSLGFYANARLGATDASNYRSLMDAKTLQACSNAKAAGVQIYTVGFSIPSDPIDSAGLSLLQSCATKPGMAFIAQDGSALISTFQTIAQQMSGLRLTN